MKDSRPPFFILGAGFGFDARGIVGPIEAQSIYIGKYQFSCAYPLVKDLPHICFPDSVPEVLPGDVEQRLADALEAGENAPIERLCETLSKADYYLAPRLVGWPEHSNPYARFFADFSGSSFATYNYDAFVEFALFRAGTWSPHDGYGVDVAVELGLTPELYELTDSKCLVLHLHGSYMVYSYDYSFGPPDKNGVRWMEPFESSKFAFDPHSLGNLFYPFQRVMAGLAYRYYLPDRLVAPIPNKASGLRGEFVRRVNQRAEELLAEQRQVVAIGYAFSETDKASYSHMLESLATRQSTVLMVSPDASEIVLRLQTTYGNIHWSAVDSGFAEWIENGYAGLQA